MWGAAGGGGRRQINFVIDNHRLTTDKRFSWQCDQDAKSVRDALTKILAALGKMNSDQKRYLEQDGQSLAAQLAELKTAKCEKIFQEKISGARSDRKQLARLMTVLTKGDVLVVTRLDRLARPLSYCRLLPPMPERALQNLPRQMPQAMP
jgi:hypothetical protein